MFNVNELVGTSKKDQKALACLLDSLMRATRLLELNGYVVVKSRQRKSKVK